MIEMKNFISIYIGSRTSSLMGEIPPKTKMLVIFARIGDAFGPVTCWRNRKKKI